MNKVIIFQNPDEIIQQNFFIKMGLSADVISKIKFPNRRIELLKDKNFIFAVIHIPEYHKNLKALNQIEINIYFDKLTLQAYVFAFDTEYFFDKYSSQINQITYSNFGELIDKFLSIILQDETKLIEHILEDTQQIKSEYFAKADPSMLIRHLTNNEINISALQLIISNQNKLFELVQPYISKIEQSSIAYSRHNISDELEFAKEFCHTMMNSINTKYNVKEADTMYKLESLMFIIFVTELVMAFALHLLQGGEHSLVFIIGLISLFATWIFIKRMKH